MPLILRSVKGSDLTPAEADGDLVYLDNRITTEIAGITAGVGIANITLSGYTLTITMTDASVYTVTFPTPNLSTQWAGAWLPSTAYTAGQMLTAYPPMGLYGVLQDHTSDLSFDAGANNTAGDFYALLLTIPAVATYFWAGSTFTPSLSYANSYIRLINAGGCVVTLPQDSDINFPVNTELHFRDCSTAGFMTFEVPTTVLLNGVDGYQNQGLGPGAVVTVKKVAADEWDLFGLLTQGT